MQSGELSAYIILCLAGMKYCEWVCHNFDIPKSFVHQAIHAFSSKLHLKYLTKPLAQRLIWES